MRVALIPPVSLLDDTDRTDMQLMLPHMLNNGPYRAKYRQHLDDRNQYVIMDNGAAEGVELLPSDYFEVLVNYLPSEMALPDVLGDREKTVAKSCAFLSEYAAPLQEASVKIGYVAQGSNVDDAFQGIKYMIDQWGWAIDTLFIPRLLGKRDHRARLNLAHTIFGHYKRDFNIHLFGAIQDWPQEVALAAKPWRRYIRSIDTSAPYSLSYLGKEWDDPGVIQRPENYFDLPEEAYPDHDVNVDEYLSWTR